MYGLDYLAGAKYVDIILREHPNGWAAGTFANTFGDASRWVPRLLETGRCPRFRVHAIWEDSHTYDPKKHDKIIIQEVRKWHGIKNKFLNVDIQFSPFCEHRMTREQIARVMDMCMSVTGMLTFVNSAERGARLNHGAVIEEYHGSLQEGLTGHNHSFDGLNQVDADIEKFKRVHVNANTQYFWHTRLNLRWNMKDTTPRKDRKAFPDSKVIDSLIYQAQSKGAVSMPKLWTSKSHAENHGPDKNGKPDTKGDKLCIICPIKTSSVDLVAANGQVVERLGYIGTYDAKPKEPVQRYRYYSDEWGYQLADKAKRIQGGNPVVSVRVNGRTYGTVNPAFRENEYRNKNG